MKKITYICKLCGFESEFLDQEIWEVKLPWGWSGKSSPAKERWKKENQEPYRLIVYEEYACLDCGVKIYNDLMKLKKVNL